MKGRGVRWVPNLQMTTTIKTENSSAMTQMDAKRKKNTTCRIRLMRKSEGNGEVAGLPTKNTEQHQLKERRHNGFLDAQ